MYLLTIFLVVVIIKFVLNLSRLISTYIMFAIFRKRPKNLAQYCPFVTSLFNSAGTQQIIISTIDSYGINVGSRDYISNSLTRSDTYDEIYTIFERTIGVYKFRMLQTINPFYWFFLPKYILEDFRITIPRIGQSILNLFYWIIGFAGTYFLEKYLDSHFHDFFQYIIDMLP